MRIIKDYNIFLCEISKLSWDKEMKMSLIEDEKKQHRMYNFDGIKKQLCKKLRGEKNFSCDAYWEKNGMRYLIEFKNRSEGNIKREHLWNKAYDSFALLLVNENTTREELAKNTILIVVYDNQKNVPNSSSYNPSKSIDKITETLKGYAKLSGINRLPVKFGLDKYKGVLYHDVHTLGVNDFKKYCYPMLFDESEV